MRIKISIIIPVYNAGPFLQKAVESALMQEETAEVLLVEDASTDDSLAVCEALTREYEKVKLYRHPDGGNHGAGASRNLGIQHASYEFIAFLDADDYYLPNRFAADKKILLENPDIDGVHNALGSQFYTNDTLQREEFKSRMFTAMKEAVAPDELFYQMTPIGRKGYFHLDTLTIRKEAIKKAGLFDPSLKLTQDTHFIVRLAAVCRIAPGNILEAVAVRGIHNSNRSVKEELSKYRYSMYRGLYEWGLSIMLPSDKLGLLWKMYFRHHFNRFSGKNRIKTKFEEFTFALKYGIKNLKLLKSTAFWSCVPIIKRLFTT